MAPRGPGNKESYVARAGRFAAAPPRRWQRQAVTETLHTRSRGVSLGGLVLQVLVFGALLLLGLAYQSHAVQNLAWLVLGGVPIWFAALLVFRQRELAALEALDLEELRREKQATAGAQALFGEGGGAGLAFKVAEARLQWMLRWLVPALSIVSGGYLVAMGLFRWQSLRAIGALGAPTWPPVQNVPVLMVALAVVLLATFLLARYASGMGRVPGWQLLRACGSYMLGNALAAIAALVALGVYQYTAGRVPGWEQGLAYGLAALMIVLGAETLINFILDIYRPRSEGTEPRAAFDSRLIGLVAEPGGIAATISEALNYQFGFQVSQTWFFKLLLRAFLPLTAAGALALWLLTSIVVVQPFEHAVLERLGRQINPGGPGAPAPWGPGLYFKWPWPIETARLYNTGQLKQIVVGYRQFDADPHASPATGRRRDGAPEAQPTLLWTDATHFGQEHFDFLACPTPAETAAARMGEEDERIDRQPVHLIRMDVAVQYRIRSDELHLFTQTMRDPDRTMRDYAWEVLSRHAASRTVEQLMNTELGQLGDVLRDLLNRRARQIGLEVVHVAVTNVHPERTVADAYRNVVKAEQQKVAAIREALVTGNQKLAAAAGNAQLARRLARMVERARRASEQIGRTEAALAEIDATTLRTLTDELLTLEALFRARVEAGGRRELAEERLLQARLDFEYGLGQTWADQQRAAAAAAQARADEEAAVAALEAALAPRRAALGERLGPSRAETLIAHVTARVEQSLWREALDWEFTPTRLGGEAAGLLAAAAAERWQIELAAEADLAVARNERAAFRAAPQVYKSRRLMEVLTEGLKDARKFFLAFDPGDRTVRVRFVAEDQASTDIINLRPGDGQP